MLKHLQKLLVIAALLVPWLSQAQSPGDLVSTFPYSCDFESTSVSGSWVTVNGTQENGWYIGTATNATTGGLQALYVSNNSGTSNAYDVNTSAASYSWAYQRFTFAATSYNITFTWKCMGEYAGDAYDFFRVFIVPDTVTLTAGVLPSSSYTWSNQFASDVPTGWIGVNGTHTWFADQSTFVTTSTEVAIPTAGDYKLVFLWLNDDNTCYNPPAAVDDIQIVASNCPRPADITLVSATSDSLIVAWPPTSADSYLVTVDGNSFSTLDTFYMIGGLNSDTYYDVTVYSICGTSDTSAARSGSFKTLCGIITAAMLPYTEDFESYSSGSSYPINNCWTKGTNNSTAYPYPYSTNAVTGNRSLYFYAYHPSSSSSSSWYCYAALPPTSVSLDSLQLSFNVRRYSTVSNYYTTYLQVGVMTDPTDISTFVPVDTIDLHDAPASSINSVEVYFDNYTGTGNYIAIYSPVPPLYNGGSYSYSYSYVDDIMLDFVPSCLKPTGLEFVSATPDSISFTWDAQSNAMGYVVSNGEVSDYTTNNYYTFGQLTPNTEYPISVRAVCAVGDTSYARTVAMRTTCVPLTAADLPYTYGFEGTVSGTSGTIDPCWHKGTNYSSTDYPYPSSTTAHSGNRSLYFYAYGSSYYSYAVLPQYSDSVNTLQMTFWSRASSSSYNAILTAGVMTDPDDISTFTPVKYCVPDNNMEFTLHEVNFDQYTGNGQYIALLAQIGPQHTYTYDYIYLDDVTLQPLPSCGHVENLSVPTATTSNAMVYWEASTLGEYSSFELQYMPDTTTDWSTAATEVVSTAGLMLTDLTPGSEYVVRVRTICDNNDTSAWEYADFRTVMFGCSEYEGGNGLDITLADGTTTNSYIPSYSTYNYGYTQQFFTAHEIGGSSVIDQVTVYPAAVSQQRTYEIYMGLSSDSSATSFITPINLTCVYNGGAIPMVANQPLTFNLTTPFNYVDSMNLVVIFRDMTGAWVSGNSFYGQSAWSNVSRYIYQDASAYTVPYNTGGTSSSFRSKIHFHGGTCMTQSTCAAPGVWVNSVTSDTVVLGIIPGAEETEWDIYIQLEGGDMTFVESTSDMYYTIGGLNPASNYTVRVMGQCDDSLYTDIDVSTECGMIRALPIIMDFEDVPTGSSTTGSTFVRCWERLNNGTSYGGYPYVSSSSTYNHTDAGTKGLYWYNTTTTGTYGDYQIVVLPQIDTNALHIDSTMLTFWAKSSSVSYDPTFYVGFISDIDSVIHDSVDNFVYYDTIRVGNNTNWQKFTVMFDRYDHSTNCSYIAIRANRPSSGWYAYVDDIRLDSIPNCSPIEDLTVKAGPVSAIMQWTTAGNNYSGADVLYRIAGSDSWSNLQVTGDMFAVLTGLTPDTTYQVRIAAICDDENSTTLSSTFKTTAFPCSVYDPNNFIDTTIGATGSTTDGNYIPSYSFYNYGYSQQIFTPSEIGGAAAIERITVYPSTVAQQRTYEIYLGHTTETSLSSGFVTPSDMTLVYNGGAIQMVADQPLVFNLTTPFNFDGSQNLVVTFRDLTGSYVSGNYFYTAPASAGAARYVYKDDSPYTPGSVSGGTALSSRNVMSFYGGVCLQPSSCAAPLAMVTDVTTTTVTVNWAPGNVDSVWVVYYRLEGDDTWTFADTANVNNYTFTNLMSGTPYEFKVEALCSDIFSSEVDAITLCAEISSFPYTEDFNSWGFGTGVLPQCWYRTGSYSSYPYIIASQNLSGNNGGSIYMYSSTGSYQTNLIMPAIDTTVVQMNQLQVVFNTMFTSTSYGAPTIEVGVVSNPEDFNTFVPVDTVYHSNYVNEWEVFEVSLANYADSGAHIAFRTVYPGTYTYFYLDDITVELIPACQRPDNLQVSNATTSSVDLSWNERGNATQWQIEYGPVGFTPGTGAGTVVTVTSNPYTLSNLPASFQADFYVKSVCSATESSPYSRVPGRISLQQVPATLPYDYNFEAAAEWDNWQTVSNRPNNWFRGNAVAHNSSYSMYVSADAGATYTPYQNNTVVNAAAYRDIDFGPIDSSFTMTFDARAGGTIANSYDGLMVFLVDTAGIPVSHSNNITSPWGSVNDLYRIARVRLDTTWQTYTCSFDTISGVKRVAFFWFNQNTLTSTALQEAAAVDNIHIDYSTCPRPVATQVLSVGSTTANLTWVGEANANYDVIYRPYPNGDSNYIATTNTNSITLTGLDPVTQYAVWVRRNCGGDDMSLTSDGITFRTSLCENSFVAQNFTSSMSTTTSSYSPLGYSLYNYSYVQMIFDSSYLAGMDGDITAFAFDPANTTSSSYYSHMTMYMANVSESDLSSAFIHPDANHEFKVVLDDVDLSFTDAGYQIVGLDSAFTWDGHSNILIAFNRQHGSYSSSTSFNAHTHPAGKMRYIYQDSGPYDPATVSGGYATATAVGDIYLISCGSEVCDAPTDLNATYITYNSAILNWNGEASEYEMQYMASGDAEWSDIVSTGSATSYDVTGLTYATEYAFRVRALCIDDDTLYSDWVEASFTTDDLPCFTPENLHTTALGYTSATLVWDADASQSQWSIHVWNSSFDTIYDASALTFTVTGLKQTLQYNAAVKSICGGGLVESEYGDTIQFTTNTCAQVTGVNVTGITTNSAVVSWTATGADKYIIEYGDRNFNQGDGTTVTVENATSYTITGLEDDWDYSVFVKAECEPGVEGDWSARFDFSTLEETTAVNTVEGGMNLAIYPNPASDVTTIALSGVSGEVQITIVDMNGRTVQSETISCEGDCTKRMEVSGLAQGAYFVRVNGENLNMVRKLVVK